MLRPQCPKWQLAILHHQAQVPVRYLFRDLKTFISFLRFIMFNYGHVDVTAGSYRGQRCPSLLELELCAVLSHLTWMLGIDLHPVNGMHSLKPSSLRPSLSPTCNDLFSVVTVPLLPPAQIGFILLHYLEVTQAWHCW